MALDNICNLFLTCDIDNMSRSAKVKFLRDAAAQAGVSPNALTNILRAQRNEHRTLGEVKVVCEDTLREALRRSQLELALYRARRCYHAGLGR